MEAGVGVLGDLSEGVVVDALGDVTCLRVDNQTDAAQVVADDAVGGAVFGHVVGHVGLAAVDETGGDVTVGVQFGDGVEGILVEPALHEGAINLFADATILAIHQILDLGAVG